MKVRSGAEGSRALRHGKVHVTLTDEEMRLLDVASEREGVSRSAAVRRVLLGIQGPIGSASNTGGAISVSAIKR